MTYSQQVEKRSSTGIRAIAPFLLGGLWVAIGIVTVIHVRSFPKLPGGQPGPALFPTVIGLLLAFFGTVLIYQTWSARDNRKGVAPLGDRTPNTMRTAVQAGSAVNVLVVLGSVVAYIALADTVGFLLIVFLILFALMYCFHNPIITSVAVAVTVAVGLYILFGSLLKVPIPAGILGFG